LGSLGLTEHILKKKTAKDSEIKIGKDVKRIFLDLSVSRLIPFYGFDKKGNKVERHLKITDRSRMTLV
jgi:hypothetical protein